MKKALLTAADSFAADSKNARTVVYLGDGRSAAKYLSGAEAGEIAGRLADARISVDSYLVGLQPDFQILGSMAGQTGGVVVEDVPEMTPVQAAAALNAAVQAPVLWPQSAKWPAEMTEVFPKRTPPLRLDRDSVVVGVYKGDGPFDIEYAVEASGGLQKLDCTIKPGLSDDANNYLMKVVELAQQNGGATLPLAGSPSLEKMRVAVNLGTQNVKELAKQAMETGNLDGAEKLLGEALRQDPNDAEAARLQNKLAKARQDFAAGKGAKPQVVPAVEPPPPPGGDLNLVGNEPPIGALAQGFQAENKLIVQAYRAEVENAVNQARRMMSTDADAALQGLKLTLEKIRQAPNCSPRSATNSSINCRSLCARPTPGKKRSKFTATCNKKISRIPGNANCWWKTCCRSSRR